MTHSQKLSSTQSSYRIDTSLEGRFSVLSDSGAAVGAFASRQQAAAFIKGQVADDNLLHAAREFIRVATAGMMRHRRIDHATARSWIREAADSGD
jgi:hypothetical protein